MIIFKTDDFTINTFQNEFQTDTDGKEITTIMPNRNLKYIFDSIAITEEMLDTDILISELSAWDPDIQRTHYEVLLNGVYFFTEKQEIARLIFRAFIDMKNNPEDFEGSIFNEKYPEIGV